MERPSELLWRVALHIGNWGALILAAGGISYALKYGSPGEGMMVIGGFMMAIGGGFALLWSLFRMVRGASGDGDS
jgi:hypothetical protein